MKYIPESLRRIVIERAKGFCEYCRIHQNERMFTYEVDHIIAEKHRGQTNEANLCLACLDCNQHKSTDFASFDPESGEVAHLFHPHKDYWGDHFTVEEGYILAVTPTGRVTVLILELNLEGRVRARQALQKAGRYNPLI